MLLHFSTPVIKARDMFINSIYTYIYIYILVRNAIKEGLKKNAESGFYRVRWAEMFPTLVSSIAQTRVRKSQQLVKRLRSCCFHHYMLYLSRSNISCFTVRCITVQTLNVAKYEVRKIIFCFQPSLRIYLLPFNSPK